MKSYITIGIILVCILAIIFGFWKFNKKPELKPVVTESTQIEENIAVTPLQPTVSITKATTTDFIEIKNQTKTSVGSKIKTGSSGRALIESSSLHQTLVDYNSEITVSDDSKNEKKTKIALVGGAVWARLSKVFDSGEYYEIKTGNAVATVRGTSFGVWYRNNFTTVIVTEGSIFLSSIDRNTGEIIKGTETVVEAGKKASVDETGRIFVSIITSTDKKEPWYIYNNPDEKPKTTATPTQTTPTPLTPGATTPTPVTTPTPTPTIQTTPFTITSISPTSVDNGVGTIFTIKGDGFQRLKSIVLGRTSITNYKIMSPTSIQVMTDGLPTGTFNVSLIDLNNSIVTSSGQITITQAPAAAQPTTNILYTAPLQ